MLETTRAHIASLILNALEQKKEVLAQQFHATRSEIAYFVLDELLPRELAQKIYQKFPSTSQTKLKKNLREHKHVAYQMDQYDTLLEETIYAFQDKRVVASIAAICNLDQLEPDEHLYAGGLSLMSEGHFLNPHLDNSHDKDRARWRVLNLLYYVSPNWKESNGGHLELWPHGTNTDPIRINCSFNRLVVMATHQKSWHSVSKITNADRLRCCVSNYYFSQHPFHTDDEFHVTSFRGRPDETSKDMLLRLDALLRGFVRKIFRKGIRENPHKYRR